MNVTTMAPPLESTEVVTWPDVLEQLRKAIEQMTPEQRNQQARWISEMGGGKITELMVLNEPHADLSGEGLEPISLENFLEDELVDVIIYPAGIALLAIK